MNGYIFVFMQCWIMFNARSFAYANERSMYHVHLPRQMTVIHVTSSRVHMHRVHLPRQMNVIHGTRDNMIPIGPKKLSSTYEK